MKMKNFLEKDYPLLQDIFCFAKEHTALFLGIWAALATMAMFALNSLEYAYRLGYYHYMFNVPQKYLGTIHASGVPASFVFGVVVSVILIVYSSAAWNAYIEYRSGKFFLKVAASITAFYIVVMSIPFLKIVITENVILDFGTAVYFLATALFLATITLVFLNCFVIAFLFNKSDTDKLERIKNGIETVQKKKEKVNAKKHVKKFRLCHLKKKEKEFDERKQKLEKRIKKNNVHVAEEKQEKTYITLQIDAYILIVTYALVFVALIFSGIFSAAMNEDFEIIYTDNIPFNEQITTKLDKSDINGLVALYQYEDKVIVSPCRYSNDKITICSTVQKVISIENVTFEHMRFQNWSNQ